MSFFVGALWIPGGLMLLWCGLQAYGNRLIFRRSRTFRAKKEDTALTVEDLEFCAEDGTALHGWWFPKAEARGALLVCHGNAGNVSDRLWIPEDLQDVPLHIFLFDYRGYGKSGGLPSEKGTGWDVRAAYEVVREKVKGDLENPPIFIYGRSLGGAVALQAAESLPIRGLILESTMTSILDVGRRCYPWLLPRLTCRHPFRSDLRIAAVKAPVLMAHSPEDEIIPFDMGEALYRRVPNPGGFYRLTGSHAEAGWQTSPEYADAFRAFILENL
ncbi:alpha/beta hydrolase [Kiritimatiellaeota bacterium B1221]|nr:alpha/beta hydrolase [Kiritimatiellaeota bacterium B1221]